MAKREFLDNLIAGMGDRRKELVKAKVKYPWLNVGEPPPEPEPPQGQPVNLARGATQFLPPGLSMSSDRVTMPEPATNVLPSIPVPKSDLFVTPTGEFTTDPNYPNTPAQYSPQELEEKRAQQEYWGDQPMPPDWLEKPIRTIGKPLMEISANPWVQLASIPIMIGTGMAITGTTPKMLVSQELASYKPAFDKLMGASLRRNLQSWSKSAGREIPPETADNFVQAAIDELSSRFLAKNALKTLFKPTKTGQIFTEAGTQVAEDVAGKTVAEYAPRLVPKYAEQYPAGQVAPKGAGISLVDLQKSVLNMGPSEAQWEIPVLKDFIDTHPARDMVKYIPRSGTYKGEMQDLTLKQYAELSGGREVRPNILTPDKKHVKWEYTLDQFASERGYPTGEALKDGVDEVRTAISRMAELKQIAGQAEPMPRGTSVQTGLPGIGKPHAQTQMFGEAGGGRKQP